MFSDPQQKLILGEFLNTVPANHDYDNDVDTEEEEIKMAQC